MPHPGENLRWCTGRWSATSGVIVVGDGYLEIDPKMLPTADPGEVRVLRPYP